VCFAVVLIGALGLIPLRFWTRRLLTEPESRAACLLWVFTPAVTLYGATCMDMVFGLVLGSAIATFVVVSVPPPSATLDGRRRTTVLGVLRNQAPPDKEIGFDISAAVQWRPFMSQNIVLNASAAALLPGKGLKQLYDEGQRGPQYSMLVNLLATF